jgi:hypothetical protein
MKGISVSIERSKRPDDVSTRFRKLLDPVEFVNQPSWRVYNQTGEHSIVERSIVWPCKTHKTGGIWLFDAVSGGFFRSVVFLLGTACDI